MRRVFVVLAAAILLATTASAGPIVIGGDSTWNSWGPGQLNGGPFWANKSYDCGGSITGNIGYYVSGTPGCGKPAFLDFSPGAFLPYLGSSTSTFTFMSDDVGPATLLQAVSSWTSEFGWFDVNDPNTLHSLFSTNSTRGVLYPLSPAGQFGFYLDTPIGIWRSTGVNDGRSHFAIFQSTTSYVIGVEDSNFSEIPPSDWDYNDMVVSIPKETPIPEPTSMFLLGTGLVGIGMSLRKRR